jgi:hypothetical protein
MFPIQNNNKQKQRKKEFPLFRRYSPRLPLILRGERERGLSTSEGGFLPQEYEGLLFRLEVGFEPSSNPGPPESGAVQETAVPLVMWS